MMKLSRALVSILNVFLWRFLYTATVLERLVFHKKSPYWKRLIFAKKNISDRNNNFLVCAPWVVLCGDCDISIAPLCCGVSRLCFFHIVIHMCGHCVVMCEDFEIFKVPLCGHCVVLCEDVEMFIVPTVCESCGVWRLWLLQSSSVWEIWDSVLERFSFSYL